MTNTFSDDLPRLLDEVNDSMVEIRHDLHAHPELAFVKSTARPRSCVSVSSNSDGTSSPVPPTPVRSRYFGVPRRVAE